MTNSPFSVVSVRSKSVGLTACSQNWFESGVLYSLRLRFVPSTPSLQAGWKNERAHKIAEKVKLFYFEYARNRHKMTTITPSYHAVR